MTFNNTPVTVAELVRQAQNGDAEAVGELYEAFRLSIYRYMFYRTSDPQTADDLTSEVFLRMINGLPGYRAQEVAFQAWLFQIAHNLLVDHYRKMSIRDHISLEEQLMSMQEPNQSPQTEQSLNSVTLRQALNRLNNEQRDVIVLRFVAGMPISEVAQTLNKSEDAIKGLQRRGLAELRAVLSDWEVKYA
jgi:RNA polymerase sigma-70 factor (ECF subfamily)